MPCMQVPQRSHSNNNDITIAMVMMWDRDSGKNCVISLPQALEKA